MGHNRSEHHGISIIIRESDVKHLKTGYQATKRSNSARRWKGPTIREIADLAGLSVATVDRVVNGRPGVSNKTRERTNAALLKLRKSASVDEVLRVALLCESGKTFNRAIDDAATLINRSVAGVSIFGTCSETIRSDLRTLAGKIKEAGETPDGLILIAR